MGIFNTRPRFDDIQIKQLSGDTITLSGTTNISGTFRYLPGATVGYVLKAIDSSGTVGWQSVSVSADTNTFVTGGTLSGNNLILGWNTGGSASAIDLSTLSDTTYWTAGTSGTGSIRVINGGSTDAIGSYAVAQGFDTRAIGSFSHSEGKGTFAVGIGSHAEGTNTRASGITSHAEGNVTTASGAYSHSEGDSTIASGRASHAEGRQTTASGDYSHAGGLGTIASGVGSVSFGGYISTIGFPLGIVISPDPTSATTSGSFAIGGGTLASGLNSFAINSRTFATGRNSHSQGERTTASGVGSHAEGDRTIASGNYSHSEGDSTTASGTASHSGGQDSIVSGTNSFIHSTNSLLTGDRSTVLGGQNITGTTSDTVYVPNLTVREDYILHSNSALEVVDIPGSFESVIKGSYTEFNWDGVTTNLLNNNNPSGSTSFLLGNFTTYPTVLNHGFLSYYGTGYTRTGTPATGNDFYRNKMVLKTAGDSAGTIFSNANPIGEWQWELDGNSRMVLTNKGELGLGLNINGTQNPSEMLHVNSGDILVTNNNGSFSTDIQNSAGPLTLLSGATTELTRFGVKTPTYDSVVFGIRGGSEPSFPGYGKQGDAFIYSSQDNNGFNIVSQPGTGTDDYVRFFVGQVAGAAGTPDLYIQGSGTTRGNIGINNETPTSKLDILGTNGYQQLRLRTNYTPSSTADTNGEIGDIAWDNSYLYIKTGTGWGRLALDYVF